MAVAPDLPNWKLGMEVAVSELTQRIQKLRTAVLDETPQAMKQDKRGEEDARGRRTNKVKSCVKILSHSRVGTLSVAAPVS